MVEQPAGSWLFKSPIWIEIIAGFYLNRTLTYQGLFGGPLLKATHLLHNMPSSQFFARKLTKALKTKFQEKQRRWKHVQECFYIKGPGGTVTGTKMMSYTSLYPQRMITAIFKTWRALKKLRAGSLKWLERCPVAIRFGMRKVGQGRWRTNVVEHSERPCNSVVEFRPCAQRVLQSTLSLMELQLPLVIFKLLHPSFQKPYAIT